MPNAADHAGEKEQAKNDPHALSVGCSSEQPEFDEPVVVNTCPDEDCNPEHRKAEAHPRHRWVSHLSRLIVEFLPFPALLSAAYRQFDAPIIPPFWTTVENRRFHKLRIAHYPLAEPFPFRNPFVGAKFWGCVHVCITHTQSPIAFEPTLLRL